ncbi:MAG TPA: acyltransferase [Verrucomicrobiae bacterium]|jgi:peptidoglycan/LPS O-acetylase OafA/YrhL
MGILRLYLALCVVAEHGNGQILPWTMLQGEQAVQIFYVISGFYMALVLSTRYSKARDFYVSRFLRIFPTYWVILLGTVVVSLAGGLLFNRWLMLSRYVSHPLAHNGLSGVSLAALFNLTIIGQDWIMFFKQDPGQSLQVTLKFWTFPNPLYWYLLLPQAWTLAVELTFYAIAPYLNRLRSSWLIGLTIGALVLRFICYQYLGTATVPWTYRFFPLQIGFFLCGMLAYRLYVRMSPHPSLQRWRSTSWRSYIVGCAILLAFLYLHARAFEFLKSVASEHVAGLVTSPVFILAIPILFLAFEKHKFDRLTGEMSYPVYLVHFLVLVVIGSALGIQPGVALARAAALASIILAAILYAVFIVRIDIRRHRLRTKNSPIDGDEKQSGPDFQKVSSP